MTRSPFTFHRLAIVGLAAIAPCPALADAANALSHVFEEELGGVYSQGWYAQTVENRNGSGTNLYVVGDGKSGDFHGILSVDCDTPQYSKWLATGGIVSPDAIPSEAVIGFRKIACEN
ncbi:MAG: hypothetical protein ABJO29_10155 [Yoonia sp.]|uniref:hypothetical protein n=1 Tax=Yoonia sp. TaxID=2212373 RepID=UPI003263DA35